jgi:hypothetical protein
VEGRIVLTNPGDRDGLMSGNRVQSAGSPGNGFGLQEIEKMIEDKENDNDDPDGKEHRSPE